MHWLENIVLHDAASVSAEADFAGSPAGKTRLQAGAYSWLSLI